MRTLSLLLLSGALMTACVDRDYDLSDLDFDNVAIGDGPIDAVFKAIDKITKTGYSLDDYSIRAVTAGEDALGEATVRLKKDGKTFTGRGVSMDIIESSVHAYISAINKVVAEEGLTCERE